MESGHLFFLYDFSPPSHKNLFLSLNTGILEDNQVCLLDFVYFRERVLSNMEQRDFEIPTPIPLGTTLSFLKAIPFNQMFSKLKPPKHTQIFWMKYFKNNQFYLQIRKF